MKTQLSEILNLPELINVWKDYVDVQTAEVGYVTVVTKRVDFQIMESFFQKKPRGLQARIRISQAKSWIVKVQRKCCKLDVF